MTKSEKKSIAKLYLVFYDAEFNTYYLLFIIILISTQITIYIRSINIFLQKKGFFATTYLIQDKVIESLPQNQIF